MKQPRPGFSGARFRPPERGFCGCQSSQKPTRRITLKVQRDGRSFTVDVTADGEGLVSHAGSASLGHRLGGETSHPGIAAAPTPPGCGGESSQQGAYRLNPLISLMIPRRGRKHGPAGHASTGEERACGSPDGSSWPRASLRHSSFGHCVTIASLRPARAPATAPMPPDDLALRVALRSHADISIQSGRPDLNRGPHRPERCALPGCATPRESAIIPDRGATTGLP